jgi:outer membrane protein assembly factor BamD
MKKMYGWLLFTGMLWLLLPSCKSEFERVRISGDPELILNKAFAYYEKEEYQKAQTLFDLVMNTIKGGKRAEQAYYNYAYTYYYLKQYTLAAYYFKNFSNTFTSSPFREEAAYLSAYSNYLLSPTCTASTRVIPCKPSTNFSCLSTCFPKANGYRSATN